MPDYADERRPAQCRACLHDGWLNGDTGCMLLLRRYDGASEPLCQGKQFAAFVLPESLRQWSGSPQ